MRRDTAPVIKTTRIIAGQKLAGGDGGRMAPSPSRSVPPPRIESQVRTGLAAGGNRIRTIGPAVKETAVERGPAPNHRRCGRCPVLNDPSSLSVRHLRSRSEEHT